MLTTQFLSGAPNWIDLGVPDVERAAAFYGGVFGWSFHSAGPDSGGYGFLQLDGKTVAALGPLMDEGAVAGWTTYFATPDADATAKLVEQHGGTVRMEPSDVFTVGRMAHFTDPAGAEFAVWQGADIRGLGLVTERGSLGWVELHVPDPAAVLPFYQAVFGWRVETMPMGSMDYLVVSTAQGDNPAIGGLVPLEEGGKPRWMPYFEVADCDATLARAKELGGTVVMPAESVEEVGRFAAISDPFGAQFAIIASATMS
ncbi:VOC family protein [Nonomuraea sp. NPDC059194]|uniref:VOC family protein n=1 Tax=Nonomuraea sp. NPDC059194 TaxID=3346764 RepID=UPI0036B9CCBC